MAFTTAGERRQRATFQNPSANVPDGEGGTTQTWANLSPASLFVKIQAATAANLERVAAGTVLSTATHIVNAPFHPDVKLKTRLSWVDRAGRTHAANVVAVVDLDQRNIELVLVVAEIVQ